MKSATATLPSRNQDQLDPLEPLKAIMEPWLREIIRQELEKVLNGHGQDHLLDAERAAEILSVSPDWLYRNARRLPFSRKLGPKMLRFSYQGIQKYLATRKIC